MVKSRSPFLTVWPSLTDTLSMMPSTSGVTTTVLPALRAPEDEITFSKSRRSTTAVSGTYSSSTSGGANRALPSTAASTPQARAAPTMSLMRFLRFFSARLFSRFLSACCSSASSSMGTSANADVELTTLSGCGAAGISDASLRSPVGWVVSSRLMGCPISACKVCLGTSLVYTYARVGHLEVGAIDRFLCGT